MEKVPDMTTADTKEFQEKPMIKFERGQKVYFRNPKTDETQEGTIMDINPQTGRMAFMLEGGNLVPDVDGETTARINLEKAKANASSAPLAEKEKEEVSQEDLAEFGKLIK